MNRVLELRSTMLVVFSSLLIGSLAFAETRTEPTKTHSLQAGGYFRLGIICCPHSGLSLYRLSQR